MDAGIPHVLVLAVFVGGGLWLGARGGETDDAREYRSNAGWSPVGLLVLIAAIGVDMREGVAALPSCTEDRQDRRHAADPPTT